MPGQNEPVGSVFLNLARLIANGAGTPDQSFFPPFFNCSAPACGCNHEICSYSNLGHEDAFFKQK